MARAILEGIHEVELQVTPEFQEAWPEPKVWSRLPVGADDAGHSRYRTELRWPDRTMVMGLEIPGLKEFNAWAPMSTVKLGSWANAMRSIKVVGKYPGGIYVYVESEEDPLFDEINAAATARVISAYAIIKNYEPGEESVVDHFLGYEAKPASEQPGPVGATGPTYGVPLSDDAKLMLVNRPWTHVTHPNADVTESNPVMVLTKSLPIEASTQDKKRAVQGRFEGLEFQTLWSPKLEAWRIWPGDGQTSEEFDRNLIALVQCIDKIIDAAEEESAT